MLEKTEVAINNGQSINTGESGHKTQNEDKQNKTTQNRNNTDPTKKTGLNASSREV